MKKFAIILSTILLTFQTFGLNAINGQRVTQLQENREKPGTAYEQKRHAVVALSSIYMRIAPDYESALETQELMGTVVEITGEKGYWREIVSPQPYKVADAHGFA